MAIFSLLAVTSLAVSGTINGNVVEKNPFKFYDPLGYTEYNALNEEYLFSYNNNVLELIQNDKVMDVSNVTVLTHGMGGNATHWLTVDSLNYVLEDNHSLPFALSTRTDRENEYGSPINNTNKYIYKFGLDEATNELRLYKLTHISEQYYYFIHTDAIDPDAINGQTILIYEGNMGADNVTITNDDAYALFEESLNTVLSGIAINQHGYLSQINLIGHSRGGLINLLYANDYPEVVNNLISLGTPYMGSDWANILVSFNKLLQGNSNYTAYDDMLDPSHIYEYSQMLNNIFGVVNSYAIGFGQTLEYYDNFLDSVICTEQNISDFADALYSMFSNFISEEICNSISQRFFDTLKEIVESITTSDALGTSFTASSFAMKVLGDLFNNRDLQNFSNFLYNLGSIAINDANNNSFILESDIAVNLDSQLGYERNTTNPVFQFRERDTIILGDENNDYYYDADHCAAPSLPWIAHNFETKNPTAIDLIIEYLNYKEGFHEHSYLNYTTNTTHSSMCGCGVYELEPENHTMVYEYKDESTHRHKCSCDECSYSVALSHNFNYEDLLDYSHKKTCLDCGYVVTEGHLMNVYVPVNFTKHMICCECGLQGPFQNHNVSPFTGRCNMCDMPITEGTDPVLPPIIGPVPIN